MPKRSFLDAIRDSINQIVSGEDNEHRAISSKQQQSSAESELEFAVIVLATEMMRLAGNRSEETEKMLLNFLDRSFKSLAGTKRRKAIYDQLFVGPQPFTRMACEQLRNLATHESSVKVIALLFEIATYDDALSVKEMTVIQKSAKYLSITNDELKALKQKYDKVNSPFVILEMEETVSVLEVKAAYRKMVLKYHPDKRADKLSEEEANKKFREVKRAYEALLKKMKG